MSAMAAKIAGLVPGKWCWTCGTRKNLSDFNEKVDEYDGLQAECKRCEECREMARRIDGATGPRTYAIEGEGRTQAPTPPLHVLLGERALEASLHVRPVSGLASVEV